jgi:hypothetical protein
MWFTKEERTKLYIACFCLLITPSWTAGALKSPLCLIGQLQWSQTQQISSWDIHSSFTWNVTFLAFRWVSSSINSVETSMCWDISCVVLVLGVSTTRGLVRNWNKWPNIIKLALIWVKLNLTSWQSGDNTEFKKFKFWQYTYVSHVPSANCITIFQEIIVWKLQKNAHYYEQTGPFRATWMQMFQTV